MKANIKQVRAAEQMALRKYLVFNNPPDYDAILKSFSYDEEFPDTLEFIVDGYEFTPLPVIGNLIESLFCEIISVIECEEYE